MKRPVIPDLVRVLLVGVGIVFLSYFVWCLSIMRIADGSVEFRPDVSYGKTNSTLAVLFTRADGLQTYVTDTESIPAAARPGDHLHVLYANGSKGSCVLSAKTLCLPVLVGTIGTISTVLGLLSRSRLRTCLSESHARVG
jgi:hypothetical protein